MPTIEQLTDNQLQKAEVFQKIQEMGAGFIINNESVKALRLTEILGARLKQSGLQSANDSFYELYEDLIVKLKMSAFEILADEEAVEIIRYHFTKFTDIQMNWEMAMVRLMFGVGITSREELRKKFKVALEQNQEFIGPKKVSEWIIGYNRAYNPRERTSLNTREFIASRGGGLELEERVKLRTLLYIYDYYLLVTPVVPAYELPTVTRYLEQGEKLPDFILGPDLPPGQSIATPEDYKVKNPFQKTSAGPGIEGNTINLRK